MIYGLTYQQVFPKISALANYGNVVIPIKASVPIDRAVQFAVKDAGPGLTTGQLDSVFEAFNTGKNGNIGLGLTICRRILEAHGGMISVANRSENGAAFTFTLPLAAAEENRRDDSL